MHEYPHTTVSLLNAKHYSFGNFTTLIFLTKSHEIKSSVHAQDTHRWSCEVNILPLYACR